MTKVLKNNFNYLFSEDNFFQLFSKESGLKSRSCSMWRVSKESEVKSSVYSLLILSFWWSMMSNDTSDDIMDQVYFKTQLQWPFTLDWGGGVGPASSFLPSSHFFFSPSSSSSSSPPINLPVHPFTASVSKWMEWSPNTGPGIPRWVIEEGGGGRGGRGVYMYLLLDLMYINY